jgi:succinyl-diaminopimelate desuccinylase
MLVAMTTPAIRYLRDYVAIPSVNPMGRDDVPAEIAGEARYAEHLAQQLRAIGLDTEILGSGGRSSVIAEARATNAVDTLMVASHLDTVPIDGMTISPFDPVIEGGRLYGRGSCDTKAGMAALLEALERVLRRGTLRRNLLIVGESDEELGSLGVFDVLKHLDERPSLRPDWVIATEPTSLQVVTHHKGIAIARLVAHGRACHSSDPSAGRNAIIAMSRAVLALDALSQEISERRDPRLGQATLSVGVISGGQAPNIVPDEARLAIDRRLLPGESAEQVQREIEDVLRRHGVEDVEVVECRMEKGSLGTPDGHPAVQACQSALRKAGLPIEPGTVAFGTDAGVFAQHALPGVVIGPGSIERAHTADEYVELDQLESAVDLFVAILEA